MFFAFFPPEVNSGLMYTGPGSGPLVAAAAAWDGLATDLYAAASSYQGVIANLTSGWSGPSSMAMAAAAAPYVTWMTATAVQAAQAGTQVKAATAAYETAFTMTVPPVEIAANRELLAALVATNIFGQNTPAIEATEIQYLQMWAQDVAAMSGYAAASSSNAQMSPFSAPPITTNTAAAATPAASTPGASSLLAAVTALGTSVQGALSSLSTSAPVTAVEGLLNSTGLSPYFSSLFSGTNSLEALYYGESMLYTPMQLLMSLGQSSGGSGGLTNMAGGDGLLDAVGQLVDGKLQLVVGGVTDQLRSWASSVSAQLASATKIGGLSIPPEWSAAAHGLSRAAPVLPDVSVASPTLSQPSAMPTSPFSQALMGAFSQHAVSSISKVPAKVFIRSPAGG